MHKINEKNQNNQVFWRRHISNYAAIENKKILTKWQSQANPALEKGLKTLKKNLNITRFKEESIEKMVLQLDRVSKNTAYGAEILELANNDRIEIDLVSNEYQIIKVNALNELCPLNVNIEKIKGQIEVYVSKKNKFPTKVFCDFIYKTNSFKISDSSYRFYTDYVYFNFFSIVNANFFVKIWFGDIINKSINHKVKSKSKTLNLTLEPEDSITENLSTIMNYNIKDFITLNKTEIIQRNQKHNFSEKSLKIREKQMQIYNKIQTEKFCKIHKTLINDALEKKYSDITGLLERKIFFEKNWIILSIRYKFINQLRMKFDSRKMHLLELKKIATSATIIQKKIIALFERNVGANVSLRRCRNILKFYHNIGKDVIKREIILNLKEIRTREIFIHLIHKKIENVIAKAKLIQKYWKYYRITEEVRFQEIFNLFQEGINDKIRSAIPARNKKRHEKMINAYKNIPVEVIIQLSQYHIERSKKNYYDQIRQFLKEKTVKISMRERVLLIKQKLLPKVSIIYPSYTYLPLTTEVSKALELYISNNR